MTTPSGTRRFVPRWMFGWADRFTDTWGAFPAQPIIYTALFFGMWNVVLTFQPSYGQSIHVPPWLGELWRFSGVTSPIVCLIGYLLISHTQGFFRLVGLYVRLAGDVGMGCSLLFFLVIRLVYAPVNDDPHIFLMWTVGGVLFFTIALIVRDVWVVMKVEEIAAILEKNDLVQGKE